ncbi:hypothetical protein BCR42DRAFT_421110 [Absidia repens]|uniref:Uncharacterized protein n=1 Tax=Absidia repens TaxID=90262 RepID=A0A1X2I834_9FUNG|nr:hypothetical protein BCR42DRAFT_421110 [Absidia repens]
MKSSSVSKKSIDKKIVHLQDEMHSVKATIEKNGNLLQEQTDHIRQLLQDQQRILEGQQHMLQWVQQLCHQQGEQQQEPQPRLEDHERTLDTPKHLTKRKKKDGTPQSKPATQTDLKEALEILLHKTEVTSELKTFNGMANAIIAELKIKYPTCANRHWSRIPENIKQWAKDEFERRLSSPPVLLPVHLAKGQWMAASILAVRWLNKQRSIDKLRDETSSSSSNGQNHQQQGSSTSNNEDNDHDPLKTTNQVASPPSSPTPPKTQHRRSRSISPTPTTTAEDERTKKTLAAPGSTKRKKV